MKSESRGRVSKKKRFLPIQWLNELSPDEKKKIIARANVKISQVTPLVSKIVDDVRENGDEALIRYTHKYDGVKLSPSKLIVSKGEIKDAYKKIKERKVPENLPLTKQIEACQVAKGLDLTGWMWDAIECIRGYHERDKANSIGASGKWESSVQARRWSKEKCKVGQVTTPLRRIGVYVPAGNVPLFTTALMAITPAKVAGVREIIVISPPGPNGDIDPGILVASNLAGATTIIRGGGAQAIAALACGTETVPRVDKVFGPGNVYVTAAKAYVATNGICAIDFLAGPTEIVVVADADTRERPNKLPKEYAIASDMMAQAEHDTNSCAILVTDSVELAKKVRRVIARKLKDEQDQKLKKIAEASLSNYGALIVAENISEALSFSNEFAPEHLEIMTASPKKWLSKVKNAAMVCLGESTPLAISDYVCPNHILPTGGTARYDSGISVQMFFKRTSFLKVDSSSIPLFATMVGSLSYAEGLYNQHGLSVETRCKRKKASKSPKGRRRKQSKRG